ncbi:glutathione S-transferase [Aurantimonas sp. 22II-16-19i]|uniref:glutathione S-transferase family protein n=1 Tax=Aurantimonas sp. 22II-16-19i TaxID=1317114 RepID=UPI0009F7B6B7|nr:glutathione S-transferase [Aurantimonas sp. 22II-16-19i]ORE97130.1 glutathione S-transferase domain-containing protein [Aurantimonas sp. 22II-16-19i]
MLTVHHLNNSRSQRVLWLLEELGAPYEVKHYQRTKDMQAPRELKQVHPLGKSPVITDEGRTIAETGAIVEYILARYGEGRLMPPEGSDDYWTVRHFLHYAEGSAMPPLFLMLVLQMIPDRAPFFAKPILKASMEKVDELLVQPQMTLHINHWEQAIGRTGWFAGPEMTVADVMMSFPVEAAAKRFGYENHPRLREFLQRIHERRAYRQALKRGGPYDYA